MGLAASQARFLGITARKSNIEYEGQQVNQQRTALSQEVNALYSKLLAMNVPVAPDVTEFYETDYSFELTNTQGYDGSYIVKNYYQNDDGTYYLDTERTYNKNIAVGNVVNASQIGTTVDSEGNQLYTYTTTNGDVYTLTKGSSQAATMRTLINDTYGVDTVSNDEEFYYFQDKNNTGLTYYFCTKDVENHSSINTLSSYYASNKEVTEKTSFPSANITFDENNRMKYVSDIFDDSGLVSASTFDMDTTRTYDTEGYDAALRDYTMSKEEYDKTVADLNAQTESLQQEDKVLELRLDQIDTEQNELQTELDAVKAVLDKNIEGTFKTFA